MKSYILLSVAGCALIFSSCSHKTDKTEETEAPVIDVAAVKVEDVQLVSTYPGYLTADKAVDAVARVNGQIVSMNYESGQMVNEGDILFTIESSKYRDLASQAKASLQTAISERDYARSHYEAVKKALASEAVSKMEVEQAESALEQAESSIMSARAALETANRNLSYCVVRAPISGQAAKNVYSVGAYVSGEGSPVTLTTVYKNDIMTANFAIEDARYLELLQRVGVTGQSESVDRTLTSSREDVVDSLDFNNVPLTFSEKLPHVYTGAVTYLSPALNRSTGTMDVQVKVKNPYNELRAGMYVDVHLPYGMAKNAILVRDASIGTNQLGKYLYVVNDSDRVVYTPITVGDLYQDTLRIVTSGLKEGDRYVTKAMLKVRDGEKVTPRAIE
ncbi:MAG: efflux RND transporter periplasmic adaptor subunit [Duncaniella sp.]|nr:efflux RND transporter periplasmic adaptor subunit [Duncaniella sp.]